MTLCPRCGCESASADWVNRACKLQSVEVREQIFASLLCPIHVQQVWGIAITEQLAPLPVPPPLQPRDCTIDDGRRF